MKYPMLNYYIFKDIIEDLPNQIKSKYTYDDNLLFNLSTFNDLGTFYKLLNPFKNDKYIIQDKLKPHFNEFIYDAINISIKNGDLKQMLFIYAMISNYILDKHLSPFINIKTNKKNDYYSICNMIDFYYAKKKDNLDLSKFNFYNHFKNSFIYHDYMDSLIHNLVSKYSNFLCSSEYFNFSMKKKEYFYKHLRNNKKMKLLYKIYDILTSKKTKPKAISYIYYNKLDTTILNHTKQSYLINDIQYNFSLDEVINNAYKEIKKYITDINNYAFYNNKHSLDILINK